MRRVASSVYVDALLEREEFLDALHVAHEEAVAGQGRVVFLTAEAGGGKTALLKHFCDVRASPSRLLWGTCDALLTPRPLGAILDLADDAGAALRNVLAQEPVPFHVASALLQELRETAPTILVLEDVHWADAATLDVLRLVIRKAEPLPVLVIASYRDLDVNAGHPLRLVLGETTGPQTERLRLPPLSRAAVAELAEPYGVDSEALYRATSGNPFFVTEALASPEAGIPETVRDAVLARAARHSRDARAVLEAVAVSTSGAELWLLEELSGPVDHRLDECLGSGMLELEDAVVTFRHELARIAIEESLASSRRYELNVAALAALEERGTDGTGLARLAHHAEAARNEGAARRYARAAGDYASTVGAHREAADQYARALRFSGGLPAEELAELLRLRSQECYLTDQMEEALDALRRAIDLYRETGDRVLEGKTMADLANILWCPGRGPEARRVGHEAVALLEQLPPGPELAWAYASRSFLCRMAADGAGAKKWGGKALQLSERLADPWTICASLITTGTNDVFVDFASGSRTLERALALADEVGETGHRVGARHALAVGAVFWRKYDLATTIIETGLAECSESGNDLMRLYFLTERAQLELAQGRWSDAADSATMILREPAVSTMPRTFALVVLALVRARRGDPDVGPLLEEAWALAEPTGEPVRIAPVLIAQAEAAWLRGSPHEVEAITRDALELAREARLGRAVGELLVWRRRSGIEDEPDGLAEEPYTLTLAGATERAAEAWTALGCPYEAALALFDSGDEQALRRTLELCSSLGAQPLAAVAARKLRELGAPVPRGPRRSTKVNPAHLTVRELEVLALLAEGLRNAEIAERLVVSRRTVDHHVSAILRKLDSKTRGEAVAAAIRLGLEDDL
jgi:DNA-binding CsgD family transcriptional regulator/tetratricopeptide (TPR) repeat protein